MITTTRPPKPMERVAEILRSPYHQRLEEFIATKIPPGRRVLHLGCEDARLLRALRPSSGIGVISAEHSRPWADGVDETIDLVYGDPGSPPVEGPFDHIIVTNVIGYLEDVWQFLRDMRNLMHESSTIVVTHYNYLWEPILRAAELLRLKRSAPLQNWLPVPDLVNLVELGNMEPIDSGYRDPFPIAPRWLSLSAGRLPAFKNLGIASFVEARAVPRPTPREPAGCTVVIPTRNERGNIGPALERLPRLSERTEVIFVDGNSTDGTVDEITRHIGMHEGLEIKLILQGNGTGKGDAIRKGFAAADGEILIILDADLTVAPEDLPKFWAAITEGKGRFINGTRLVYPMEHGAMRIANVLGNKIFGAVFSWILRQRITDTLCGTKVLGQDDYERIAAGRVEFGDFDPFGDFDLLFGAARIGLVIREVPIRYRARTYGSTNIDRWRHGLLLLKMAVVGARKLRFR